MAFAVLVFRPERGTLRALVKTSAAWSIALLVALTFAWYFDRRLPSCRIGGTAPG